jgi:molybdopterin-binding protein
MASVTLQCGRHRIEAVMSTEAVRELDLQPGSLAVAVVKATQVLLETPDATSGAGH